MTRRAAQGPREWVHVSGRHVELRQRGRGGGGVYVHVDGARVGYVVPIVEGPLAGRWTHLPRRFRADDQLEATRTEAANALVDHRLAEGLA